LAEAMSTRPSKFCGNKVTMASNLKHTPKALHTPVSIERGKTAAEQLAKLTQNHPPGLRLILQRSPSSHWGWRRSCWTIQ
jgi:hypothetical protein